MMIKDPTLPILIILNAIAFMMNAFFLIIKTKDHVQKKKHTNQKKKRVHNQPWRNPSLNSNPEAFKNQNQNKWQTKTSSHRSK